MLAIRWAERRTVLFAMTGEKSILGKILGFMLYLARADGSELCWPSGVARVRSMKFGEYLEANLYPEWRFYYVDYEGLKYMLKGRGNEEDGGDVGFSEKDEANFVEALEKEMEKVRKFRP